MEAATLAKKKTGINKGKMKKSLRNVLCRPDPVFWPEVSNDHKDILQSTMKKYKVDIPIFKKPHWKDIKSIPKDQRPKPPKLPRVEGLLFGITEVKTAIQNKQCSAVLIESSINPRMIVQPLIEQCVESKVPTLCLNGLKKITATYFGIPTSCLGIKCDFLEDFTENILELAKLYKPPQKNTKESSLEMEVDENNDCVTNTSVPLACPYLYRTSKRTRVFNPSLIDPTTKKAFVGQDFIEFTDKPEKKSDSKAFMSMILKKISNNQNRVKRK